MRRKIRTNRWTIFTEAKLEEQEADIEQLEQRLDKVLKMCGLMIDAGKSYVAQQSAFANSLWDLSTYFREDVDVMTCLNKLIHALQEMNKFHSILLDQASRTILKNLTSFIKGSSSSPTSVTHQLQMTGRLENGDIKSVKESRHYFEKISVDLDTALSRNSQAPRNKPQEAEETQNLLSATRSCFRHTALDYVHSLSLLQTRKRHEVLGTLLSYMHACSTYFHQGSDLCQDLEPFFKKLAEEVVTMRKQSCKLEKEMENRHTHVTSADYVQPPTKDGVKPPRMEGYLFKRTSNAFKTWNRRWFTLQENKLVYCKRTGEDNVTIMEEDLRLCSVKPVHEGDRRFCFEVLSPSKSHMLQADSEEMLQCWISAMQQGIGAALQQSLNQDGNGMDNNNAGSDTKDCHSPSGNSGGARPGDSTERPSPDKNRKARMWEQLLKIPGNDRCCDCGNSEPRWASINLGITLCIECSGVHRSLGVHFSKVRSLTLDAWEPEILKVMAELGNTIVNSVYEANIPTDVIRATPKCQDNIREAWIKRKYVERQFVKQLSVPESNLGDHRASRSITFTGRKWSVRKLRRRPRSRDSRSKKDLLGCETVSDSGEPTSQTGIEVTSISEEITNDPECVHVTDSLPEEQNPSLSSSDANTPVSAEVLAFGKSLEKQTLDGSIELSSDQDSTGGEEDEFIGEEDISKLDPNRLLYKAAAAHNLPVMLKALALGADKQWMNEEDHNRTPLHQAIFSGSVMACEFLLLNGAKINSQDSEGKTPLHLATELGHTAQVCLLLKHRADQHIPDKEGTEPLTVAIREANADIVTLLRLSMLNEQMRTSEMGSTGDDTFNDVVRDFSQLACSHPERLFRTKGSPGSGQGPSSLGPE
ncbi:arf-GAP with coiled-coil, ANK repeat and PH domain-containing protein 2 isoform X2 [Schistocerca gregaria]|uniref:arf-GAP with coiled-coil, ANK repeat and PH domain-containing protein 2 isoform X2 n=1 Tax=Schistocerca gregaria TaxID=7010 RepID=UPI00211DC453|nr:arf-GAP with coiled-coil, ANK repeat and PH domain-containing protein 2 isoform X2 [Schistocerca gregaria]